MSGPYYPPLVDCVRRGEAYAQFGGADDGSELAPVTVSSGEPITLGQLFGVSVAAGVTVWGVTRVLTRIFGGRSG